MSISEQADRLLEAPPGFLSRFFRRKNPSGVAGQSAGSGDLAALEQRGDDLETALRQGMVGGIVGEFDRWNHEQYRKWLAKRKKLGLPPPLSGLE